MTSPPGSTIVVLQPSYLPWLGYFDQLRRADIFVLYDDVQYDKHGWRNRNRVKTAQGPQWLTVPVLHRGQQWPRVSDVRIDHRTRWAPKHLRTLRESYAKAPHLHDYLPALELTLMQEWERLVDLNLAVLKLMVDWLRLSTPIVLASELGIVGDRTSRLVNICRHLGAARYLSGDAAREYLDVEQFAAAGIAVDWQSFQHPSYPQLHGPFVPYLSAIDVLLNCGPDSATVLVHGTPGRPSFHGGSE